MLRLALVEPDIPQNTGTLMRLARCLGLGLDVIEPCGFVLDDRRLRRAGMDYLDGLDWARHRSWSAFRQGVAPGARLLLLSAHATQSYTRWRYRAGDILLLGSESRGVPPHIHDSVDARLLIPMQPGCRSLNVALAAALVAGEALRQLGPFAAGD